MNAKQVNNAEGNQDGFAISTLKKVFEEGGHDHGIGKCELCNRRL